MNYLMKGALLGLVVALQACSSGDGSSEPDDNGGGLRSVSMSANNLNGRLVLDVAGQRVELDSHTDANQAVEVGTEDLVTAKVIEQPGIQSCVFGNEVGKTTLTDVESEAVLNCENLIFFTARDNDEFRYGLWRTDGTTEGTLKIVDLPEFGEPSAIPPAIRFYPVPGTMLMRMPDGQLWTTDGTTQGTRPYAVYADWVASDVGRVGEYPFLTITDPHNNDAKVKLIQVSQTGGVQETGFEYHVEPGIHRWLYPRADGLFEAIVPDRVNGSTLDEASLYWRSGAGFAERKLLSQVPTTGWYQEYFSIMQWISNANIYAVAQNSERHYFSLDGRTAEALPLYVSQNVESVNWEADEGSSGVWFTLERSLSETVPQRCMELWFMEDLLTELILDGCVGTGERYYSQGLAFGRTLFSAYSLVGGQESGDYWFNRESRAMEPLPEPAHILLGDGIWFGEGRTPGDVRLFFVVNETDEPTDSYLYGSARMDLFTASALEGPYERIFSADKAIGSFLAFDPFWTSSSALRIHDRHLFKAHKHETGTELWITDGTSAGTQLLRDINPGPGSAQNLSVAELEPEELSKAFGLP